MGGALASALGGWPCAAVCSCCCSVPQPPFHCSCSCAWPLAEAVRSVPCSSLLSQGKWPSQRRVCSASVRLQRPSPWPVRGAILPCTRTCEPGRVSCTSPWPAMVEAAVALPATGVALSGVLRLMRRSVACNRARNASRASRSMCTVPPLSSGFHWPCAVKASMRRSVALGGAVPVGAADRMSAVKRTTVLVRGLACDGIWACTLPDRGDAASAECRAAGDRLRRRIEPCTAPVAGAKLPCRSRLPARGARPTVAVAWFTVQPPAA